MSKQEKPAGRRLPAEWEPQSAVQLTLPHAGTDWADVLEEVMPCFHAVAREVAKRQVLVLVSSDWSYHQPMFADLPKEKVRWIELPSNDTWARDHGGIVVEYNGSFEVLDFQFNGWGLKFPADRDNLITSGMWEAGLFKAQKKIWPGMILEGGGIESDGKGTILTTEACLLSPNRNPQWTKKQIEKQLHKWLGAKRVLWLAHGHLEGDDTDSHIDTLARLCDEHTIAYVRCDRPEDPHYEALKAMETELKQMKTAAGKPYQLVPLPWPDACFAPDGHRLPATYANFLIINGAVLVPVYGLPQDEAALSAIQQCFIGREIVGINCLPLILQHGSLHCVTMQYPAGVIS